MMMGIKAVVGSASAVWLGRVGDRIGHTRILMSAALASVFLYLPQAFVNHTWQLILLQALSGLTIGGIIPSVNALMNLQAPTGNQGAAYGLNASITVAGRGVAPLLGAAFSMWLGMRSVFVLSAAVYSMATLIVFHIQRQANFVSKVE
jgi:DHA1 family multidrug resistance protein-like MFS transporter